MRRLTLGLLAILAICLGVKVATLLEPSHLVPVTMRLARFVVSRANPLGARAAWAADEMQFSRVSPESAAQIERRMRPRRGTTVITRVSGDTLTPIPPMEPDAPLPPGRSGEMMRIGSDIHIEKDQTVVGDVVAISGDVTVDGHVKGDVTALRGDVYLGSTARVDGDVACIGGELHEDSGAFVGGQRVTALGGRVTKRIHDRVADGVDDTVERAVKNFTRFGATLAWLLVMLGLIWLAIRIAGGRTAIAVDVLRRETAASLGVGLLAWVLIVPSLIALCLVVAILCITIIGIPVAIAALFAYGVLLAVLILWGFIVGLAWFGEQLGRRFAPAGGFSLTRYAMFGALVIIGGRSVGYLLHAIPGLGFFGGFLVVISWIVSSLVTTLGAGSLLRSEFATGLVGRWWRGTRTPRATSVAPGAPAAPVAPPPYTEPPQTWSAPPPSSAPPVDPGAPGSGPSIWPPS
jgi:hypothetical protein